MGTVTDQRGVPIPHARLDLRGPSQSAQAYAGVDGDFAMTLPAGTTWTLAIDDMYFLSETRTLKVARRNEPLKIVLKPRWGVRFDGAEQLKLGCG